MSDKSDVHGKEEPSAGPAYGGGSSGTVSGKYLGINSAAIYRRRIVRSISTKRLDVTLPVLLLLPRGAGATLIDANSKTGGKRCKYANGPSPSGGEGFDVIPIRVRADSMSERRGRRYS